MTKKRILFLMSDTGGGHRAAAEAIRDALEIQHSGEVEVTLVDVFRDYSSFPFKNAPELYPWLVKYGKSSWGASYNFSNTRQRAKLLSRGMYVSNEKRLKQMLREHPADVVVCVHSILTRVAMQAMMSLRQRPPFMVVVTDLVSTHMFWFDKRADRTLLPTQPAWDNAIDAGLDPDKMRIIGLPVHPRFSQSLPNKAEARASLGWHPTLPVFLIIGGGDGMGPVYKTARAIDEGGLPCQLAIIAGRNQGLKDKLTAHEWNQPTHIYGFVNDMPRWMAAADVLVTKAGPATISEACIAGLPMLIYDAIPGQEVGNVDYVVDNQAGEYVPGARLVADAAQRWLSEGADGLARRSQAAAKLARPKAVWEIADEVWDYAHDPLIVREKRNLLKDVAERARQITAI